MLIINIQIICSNLIHKSGIEEGQRIYYNFVKPHETLEEKTPAEKCGIKIEDNDKWMTIIQNAKKELAK